MPYSSIMTSMFDTSISCPPVKNTFCHFPRRCLTAVPHWKTYTSHALIGTTFSGQSFTLGRISIRHIAITSLKLLQQLCNVLKRFSNSPHLSHSLFWQDPFCQLNLSLLHSS